jgi:tetratricopeptide (TPR) repeat protein
MRRRVAGLAGLACVALLTRSASAETPPSMWDRAEHPGLGARYRLHIEAQERFAEAAEYSREARGRAKGLSTLFYERARAELEQGGAATSPDLRLRFDLAEALYRLERWSDVLALLKPALATAPRSVSTAEAWYQYALAAAKLDRSKDEIYGYDQYLAAAPESVAVPSVLSNRAEAYMREGVLVEAVAGYREVIDSIERDPLYSQQTESLVLAHWGLTVALDRSGSRSESEQEAWKAAQMDPTEGIIGDTDGVFFVPEYERYWYLALGRAARAKHETDPEIVFRYTGSVVKAWTNYIAEASRASPPDRWLPLARSHLARAERDRKAAYERWRRAAPTAPKAELSQ